MESESNKNSELENALKDDFHKYYEETLKDWEKNIASADGENTLLSSFKLVKKPMKSYTLHSNSGKNNLPIVCRKDSKNEFKTHFESIKKLSEFQKMNDDFVDEDDECTDIFGFDNCEDNIFSPLNESYTSETDDENLEIKNMMLNLQKQDNENPNNRENAKKRSKKIQFKFDNLQAEKSKFIDDLNENRDFIKSNSQTTKELSKKQGSASGSLACDSTGKGLTNVNSEQNDQDSINEVQKIGGKEIMLDNYNEKLLEDQEEEAKRDQKNKIDSHVNHIISMIIKKKDKIEKFIYDEKLKGYCFYILINQKGSKCMQNCLEKTELEIITQISEEVII